MIILLIIGCECVDRVKAHRVGVAESDLCVVYGSSAASGTPLHDSYAEIPIPTVSFKKGQLTIDTSSLRCSALDAYLHGNNDFDGRESISNADAGVSDEDYFIAMDSIENLFDFDARDWVDAGKDEDAALKESTTDEMMTLANVYREIIRNNLDELKKQQNREVVAFRCTCGDGNSKRWYHREYSIPARWLNIMWDVLTLMNACECM